MTAKQAYKDKSESIDITDVSTWELKDELRYRGEYGGELEDFESEELVEELKRRGEIPDSEAHEFVTEIYQLRRIGKDYQPVLDKLIYHVIGKIV